MDNLLIKETKSSPEVNFDAISQVLSMRGNLYPEHVNKFIAPVIKWLEEFFKNHPEGVTIVNLEMIYVNSSSSRALYQLFSFFNEIKEQYEVEINWVYEQENDTSEEMGEDFIEDYEDLNINLVVK
ncbi:MAG: DUF1987 domain-containing protein [Gammaproteobacteria bacterium]|nr:DUF1987 domain-containing protein [Gammaproteobacteria bacterium]